jgi:hypothetical protein
MAEEKRVTYLKAQRILLALAIVCFIAAAIDVSIGNLQLIPIGLAAFAASFWQ